MGLSQRKLVEKLGMDPGTIWKWEKGRNKPIKEYRNLIFKIPRVDWKDRNTFLKASSFSKGSH
jgi:transcriptional regulator with XRE-family HTH domain